MRSHPTAISAGRLCSADDATTTEIGRLGSLGPGLMARGGPLLRMGIEDLSRSTIVRPSHSSLVPDQQALADDDMSAMQLEHSGNRNPLPPRRLHSFPIRRTLASHLSSVDSQLALSMSNMVSVGLTHNLRYSNFDHHKKSFCDVR